MKRIDYFCCTLSRFDIPLTVNEINRGIGKRNLKAEDIISILHLEKRVIVYYRTDMTLDK